MAAHKRFSQTPNLTKLFVLFPIALLVLAASSSFLSSLSLAQTDPNPAPSNIKPQTEELVNNCLTCHGGIEKMHASVAVQLACVDCHGGDPTQLAKDKAHVKPKFPNRWPTSANPKRTYALLNEESPAFIKFVNPGDLRIADETCGSCHSDIVLAVKKSMMTTSSLLWGGAAYNNGIVSTKHYILGESYSREGDPQQILTTPAPTEEELARGVLPTVLPLPRWQITQPGNLFRSFERGGKVPRINPSEIGIPNPLEEPGRPDMKLGDRGLGTQLRISSPVLNLHKTRLNDPHLSFMGTNDHPGDFRSSGCTGCHSVYANDRSPIHSGPYAKFGSTGQSQSADTTIPKNESGHPLLHQFTRAIPSSQCMVCHMHQPNAFINTYFGYQMWDYETDGEKMYPKKQKFLSSKEEHDLLSANPEEAVLRGNWGDSAFLENVSDMNPTLKRTQFADYHGHGWLFRAVFKKDRKGNLLDKDGKKIDWNDEHKFHGVVPSENIPSPYCDSSCLESPKAVHMNDIHAEKGMHCVDCHFSQDNHGDGKLYGEFHNALEIECVDCHGTIDSRSTLATSGLAAPEGGTNLRKLTTTKKLKRFLKKGKRIIQRSMLHDSLEWEIPQLVDIVNPESKHYNKKAALAKLVGKSGSLLSGDANPNSLAHAQTKMECYSCHSSWVTNCFGCHLPQQANWKKDMNHYEGDGTRNWTSYNPQVLRDASYMLCVNATSKGNKIAPARSSSALILSSRNSNREQIYLQQPPISAPGYSSQAFNPHVPHTVRTTETKTCVDCHLSEKLDNNAWMAQLLLQGTNMVNFIGKYAYVATGEAGLEAVQVTETDEPQAVIGSYLHSLAYSDYYAKHLANDKQLETSHHHSGNALSIQMRGEYLYTANGEGGFRVYDIANIDNKGYSERIVTSPVSARGQNTHVSTKFATAVALPTNMPIDTRRTHRPENQEQWPIHPLYAYAYVTDLYEGLILVNVMNLVDGDPQNNFLKRDVTFNPGGILDGATNLTIAGNYVYVCCKSGLVIVSVVDPLHPKVVASIDSPLINEPKAVAVQFRYAFVCERQGLKVIDITDPTKPKITQNNLIPLAEANDVYVGRTYAYVAAGSEGLVIVDVEQPENMSVYQKFTAGGAINDARGVKVAATNASFYAYLADGKHGLRVIQLTSPQTEGYLGFSPEPNPELIATKHTHGSALSISKGLDRDRAVDESGNQISIFGRLGSRPMTLKEQRKMYMRSGKIWTVTEAGKVTLPNDTLAGSP